MKWLKDRKVTYFKKGYTQDKSGGQHARYERMGTLWAHVSGNDYKGEVAAAAFWDKETYSLTFSRPPYDIALKDIIYFDNKGFEIVSINELSGRIGLDVRVLIEMKPHWTVPSDGIVEP